MRTKLFAALFALMFLPATAFAFLDQDQSQGQSQSQAQSQGQSQGQAQGQAQKSVNKNYNSNTAGAAAGAAAASKAKAGAVSGAAAGSYSGGNSVTVSNDTDVDAEPAYAPNVSLTSHDCIGSLGVSGGGGGVFSFGIGTTRVYEDCERRELVKLAKALGDDVAARKLFYSITLVQRAMSDPGHKVQVTEAGEVVQVNTSTQKRPSWCDNRDTFGMSAADKAECDI